MQSGVLSLGEGARTGQCHSPAAPLMRRCGLQGDIIAGGIYVLDTPTALFDDLTRSNQASIAR